MVTVKGEGLRAVYKGVTPPLLATGIINSLLFGMQVREGGGGGWGWGWGWGWG